MADRIQAVGALLLVALTGFLIATNLLHVGNFGLNLSLKGSLRTIDFIMVLLARLVGATMVGVSGWVIYNIARN